MSLKKLIAGIGIVLVTAFGGIGVSQHNAAAIPWPGAAPASIEPGDGDSGIWP